MAPRSLTGRRFCFVCYRSQLSAPFINNRNLSTRLEHQSWDLTTSMVPRSIKHERFSDTHKHNKFCVKLSCTRARTLTIDARHARRTCTRTHTHDIAAAPARPQTPTATHTRQCDGHPGCALRDQILMPCELLLDFSRLLVGLPCGVGVLVLAMTSWSVSSSPSLGLRLRLRLWLRLRVPFLRRPRLKLFS